MIGRGSHDALFFCTHIVGILLSEHPTFTLTGFWRQKSVSRQEEVRALKVGDGFDVPESSGELLVVHLWLVLSDAPSSGNLIRVGHLELPTITSPVDEVLAALVGEELQEELKCNIIQCKSPLIEIFQNNYAIN